MSDMRGFDEFWAATKTAYDDTWANGLPDLCKVAAQQKGAPYTADQLMRQAPHFHAQIVIALKTIARLAYDQGRLDEVRLLDAQLDALESDDA